MTARAIAVLVAGVFGFASAALVPIGYDIVTWTFHVGKAICRSQPRASAYPPGIVLVITPPRLELRCRMVPPVPFDP